MQGSLTSEADRVPVAAYRPERPDLSHLASLAVPVVLVQVGMMMMGAVDTVMVGRLTATDLAAVAIGNLYFLGVAVFGMGVLFALDPVISQAVGARDSDSVARGVQRGCLLALLLTALASALLFPAGPILGALISRPKWCRSLRATPWRRFSVSTRCTGSSYYGRACRRWEKFALCFGPSSPRTS